MARVSVALTLLLAAFAVVALASPTGAWRVKPPADDIQDEYNPHVNLLFPPHDVKKAAIHKTTAKANHVVEHKHVQQNNPSEDSDAEDAAVMSKPIHHAGMLSLGHHVEPSKRSTANTLSSLSQKLEAAAAAAEAGDDDEYLKEEEDDDEPAAEQEPQHQQHHSPLHLAHPAAANLEEAPSAHKPHRKLSIPTGLEQQRHFDTSARKRFGVPSFDAHPHGTHAATRRQLEEHHAPRKLSIPSGLEEQRAFLTPGRKAAHFGVPSFDPNRRALEHSAAHVTHPSGLEENPNHAPRKLSIPSGLEEQRAFVTRGRKAAHFGVPSFDPSHVGVVAPHHLEEERNGDDEDDVEAADNDDDDVEAADDNNDDDDGVEAIEKDVDDVEVADNDNGNDDDDQVETNNSEDNAASPQQLEAEDHPNDDDQDEPQHASNNDDDDGDDEELDNAQELEAEDDGVNGADDDASPVSAHHDEEAAGDDDGDDDDAVEANDDDDGERDVNGSNDALELEGNDKDSNDGDAVESNRDNEEDNGNDVESNNDDDNAVESNNDDDNAVESNNDDDNAVESHTNDDDEQDNKVESNNNNNDGEDEDNNDDMDLEKATELEALDQQLYGKAADGSGEEFLLQTAEGSEHDSVPPPALRESVTADIRKGFSDTGGQTLVQVGSPTHSDDAALDALVQSQASTPPLLGGPTAHHHTKDEVRKLMMMINEPGLDVDHKHSAAHSQLLRHTAAAPTTVDKPVSKPKMAALPLANKAPAPIASEEPNLIGTPDASPVKALAVAPAADAEPSLLGPVVAAPPSQKILDFVLGDIPSNHHNFAPATTTPSTPALKLTQDPGPDPTPCPPPKLAAATKAEVPPATKTINAINDANKKSVVFSKVGGKHVDNKHGETVSHQDDGEKATTGKAKGGDGHSPRNDDDGTNPDDRQEPGPERPTPDPEDEKKDSHKDDKEPSHKDDGGHPDDSQEPGPERPPNNNNNDSNDNKQSPKAKDDGSNPDRRDPTDADSSPAEPVPVNDKLAAEVLLQGGDVDDDDPVVDLEQEAKDRQVAAEVEEMPRPADAIGAVKPKFELPDTPLPMKPLSQIAQTREYREQTMGDDRPVLYKQWKRFEQEIKERENNPDAAPYVPDGLPSDLAGGEPQANYRDWKALRAEVSQRDQQVEQKPKHVEEKSAPSKKGFALPTFGTGIVDIAPSAKPAKKTSVVTSQALQSNLPPAPKPEPLKLSASATTIAPAKPTTPAVDAEDDPVETENVSEKAVAQETPVTAAPIPQVQQPVQQQQHVQQPQVQQVQKPAPQQPAGYGMPSYGYGMYPQPMQGMPMGLGNFPMGNMPMGNMPMQMFF